LAREVALTTMKSGTAAVIRMASGETLSPCPAGFVAVADVFDALTQKGHIKGNGQFENAVDEISGRKWYAF